MQATSTEKGTVLVVDDTPANLGVLFEQLGRFGFRVLLAEDGPNAIRQAQTDQPDLILLDVLMPDIDGLETCRRLKENKATREIPVIFMTALTDVESKVQGFEVGGVDYVTKPIQWQEVLARLTTHLTLSNLHRSLHQEIEERKRAQAELAQEHNLLRTLIDNIPDYIYIKNTDGQFIIGNSAYARAIGATEVAGRTEFDFQPEALAMPRYRRDQQLLETGQPLVDHEEHERENGRKRWFLTTKVPLRDEQGQIVGLISISRDITERKREEEALRRYTQRLQTLHEIDRQILAGQAPAAIAQTALRHLRRFIPCQRASVVTFGPGPKADTVTTARVLAVDADGETSLRAGAPVPVEAFRVKPLEQGQIQVVDILALSEQSPVEQALLKEGVSTYVNIPLVAQAKLVGALNLGAHNPDVFTTSRLEIAQEVVVPLTLAIQHTRLQE